MAEQAGLAFAFRSRACAILVVSLWLCVLVPWPRSAYYLAFCAAFFLTGSIPFSLRRHRWSEPIKLCFVTLDVALITAAILVPPPVGIGLDWPIQARLRGPEFLYLLLLLGEAALTYSPLRVAWTGLSIASIWFVGFRLIYDLPATRRFADAAESYRSDSDLLSLVFDPRYASVDQAMTQIVLTGILTGLLGLAVLRSRIHLLAEAKAEVGRSDLARYVSPDVAQALTEQVSVGFGEPTTRVVTVLFADIVGFTGATERLSPDRTFALLRSFHERSSRVVVDHHGTIDKYLGDGLMATFGALRDEEDAARRGIACALALLGEVERWNAKRRAQGATPVRIAIGVHCGPVMVGNLGSPQRIEFTVVGDVVNVASRLEKASRDLGCTLVASDACVRAAGEVPGRSSFVEVTELRLRGRDVPLLVHLNGRGAPSSARGGDP